MFLLLLEVPFDELLVDIDGEATPFPLWYNEEVLLASGYGLK